GGGGGHPPGKRDEQSDSRHRHLTLARNATRLCICSSVSFGQRSMCACSGSRTSTVGSAPFRRNDRRTPMGSSMLTSKSVSRRRTPEYDCPDANRMTAGGGGPAVVVRRGISI